MCTLCTRQIGPKTIAGTGLWSSIHGIIYLWSMQGLSQWRVNVPFDEKGCSGPLLMMRRFLGPPPPPPPPPPTTTEMHG